MNEKQLNSYKSEIDTLLLENESVENIYGLMIDYACLTDKRLIFVDKSFVSKKSAIISIPFRQIKSASILKGGMLSFVDKIEVSTGMQHHELSFFKGENVKQFYNNLIHKII